MSTNRDLCRDCQSRPVEYQIGVNGNKLAHGYCRDCYERRAARNPGTSHRTYRRPHEARENVRETKYGVDR